MIIYPVFLFIPGLFALFAAFSNSHYHWLFLLLPVMLLPGALKRLRLMVVISAGLLAARIVLVDIGTVGAILHIAGTVLLMTAFAVQCPRCGGPVASRTPSSWSVGPKSGWCPICGRRREGIWPFQYALRPEHWDGEYHDEGGGAPSGDSTVDWQREILFRRWREIHRS